jgi:hypothetical protein
VDGGRRRTLRDVLRQQEVEQRVQPLVQLLQAPVTRDELHHPLVAPRQRAQLGLIVRVGQEAHVEGQVLAARGSVLEAEAHERQRHAAGRLAR